MKDARFFEPGRYHFEPSVPITHVVETSPEPGSALDRDGFVIAWPNGERWAHQHYVGKLDAVPEQEAA